MYKIVITELPPPIHLKQPEFGEEAPLPLTQAVERYSQTVDVLDILAVMAAVNRKPRKRRTTKTP